MKKFRLILQLSAEADDISILNALRDDINTFIDEQDSGLVASRFTIIKLVPEDDPFKAIDKGF